MLLAICCVKVISPFLGGDAPFPSTVQERIAAYTNKGEQSGNFPACSGVIPFNRILYQRFEHTGRFPAQNVQERKPQ